MLTPILKLEAMSGTPEIFPITYNQDQNGLTQLIANWTKLILKVESYT